MKRIRTVGMVVLFLSLLAPLTAATQITGEDVLVNVAESGEAQVEATVNISSLTTDQFSYFMPYTVTRFQARVDGEPVSCERDDQSAGTRFVCDVPRYENLSVDLTYVTRELVKQTADGYRFRYLHNILSPTDRYHLRLVLPEGFALSNGSASTSPEPMTITSAEAGRHFLVEWEVSPSLGEQVAFTARYEPLQGVNRLFHQFRMVMAGFIVVVLLLVLLLIVWNQRRQNRSEEVVMQVLQPDEQEILRFLKQEGGECRQSEIVKQVSYSKAKVSTVLSDLEDRGIVERVKDGRTNIVRTVREITES